MGSSKHVLLRTASIAALVLSLGGIGLSSAAAAAPTHQPIVATTGGLVRGASTGGVNEFLGLPYAAPPVGALRWRPPQAPSPWHGIRNATAFAPHCPQNASPFGQASTSEDCLYLNVYTPARAHGRLPVIVWIHGGALVTGESDDYEPSGLVADGAIVVTINYRLGALGFLAHPALSGPGGSSGDYGLMDQQAALRWVQRNIARFGGDTHDVTIAGESAGGLSVTSQLVSRGARGLFQRAVIESGAYALNTASLATAEAGGEAFATQAGCADQTAACLRALPVATVLANEDAAGYQPDVDGSVLTQPIGTALADGDFARVPIVDGSNHDEYRLFVALDILEGQPVDAADYPSVIASTFGVPDAVAAAIVAEYPLSNYPSAALALGAAGTDAVFACPALTLDRSVSRYVPTYAYEFNDENAPEVLLPPLGFPYGAAHASEIQYLFGGTPAFPATLSPAQQRLAATMKADWTTFAAFGRPSLVWPRFTAAGQRIESLTEPRPTVETDFAAEHNCAFWSAAA